MDEILRLLRDGDKRGLELLFKQFYKPLVMYAAKFVGCPEDAEDAVQDVFVKLWESRQFESIERNVRSYLYQSVYNRCMDMLEANRGIRVELSDNVLGFTEEDKPNAEEWNTRMEEIYAAIENLPPRTRTIFKAIMLEGQPYKKVADEQHVSVNTIKTTLQRALTTLREELGDKAFLTLLLLL